MTNPYKTTPYVRHVNKIPFRHRSKWGSGVLRGWVEWCCAHCRMDHIQYPNILEGGRQWAIRGMCFRLFFNLLLVLFIGTFQKWNLWHTSSTHGATFTSSMHAHIANNLRELESRLFRNVQYIQRQNYGVPGKKTDKYACGLGRSNPNSASKQTIQEIKLIPVLSAFQQWKERGMGKTVSPCSVQTIELTLIMIFPLLH